MAFDPFERAWDYYDQGGLEKLEEVEAPLSVIVPDAELAQRVADNNQDVDPRDLRWVILPDASPVAPSHLVIAGGRAEKWDEISDVESSILNSLAKATSQHLKRVLRPQHGTTTSFFGEQVPTAHAHVLARELPEHGTNWNDRSGFTSVEKRQEVRGRLAFAETPFAPEGQPGLTGEQIKAVAFNALLRFAHPL